MPKETDDENSDGGDVSDGNAVVVVDGSGVGGHPEWSNVANLQHIISINCNWLAAYEYMFGAALLSTDTSDEDQAAQAIVTNLDESMKWGTVKALYETHPDKRVNSKMKVAVVKALRFNQWDFRTHLAASLESNDFNFVVS